jgi:hypothetical protein
MLYVHEGSNQIRSGYLSSVCHLTELSILDYIVSIKTCEKALETYIQTQPSFTFNVPVNCFTSFSMFWACDIASLWLSLLSYGGNIFHEITFHQSFGGGLVEGWQYTEQETADLCFSKSFYITWELNFKESLLPIFWNWPIHILWNYG